MQVRHKTTTITKLISELGLQRKVHSLSARRGGDAELIAALPEMSDIGTVIVDDFHRLRDDVKALLIGINKAGQQLVKFAHDLGTRIDVFRLEANPAEKIQELIAKGEAALNIDITERVKIADRAQGSFRLRSYSVTSCAR